MDRGESQFILVGFSKVHGGLELLLTHTTNAC